MDSQPTPPSIATPTTPGIAITSLVLGILAFTCFGPLSGIPAIICGHKARTRIAASGGTLGGAGMGLAGLILGYVNLGLCLVMIPMLAAIAIPNFVRAREVAQANQCINHLRLIDGAKQQWALENKKSSTDTTTTEELRSYLIRGNAMQLPTCPLDKKNSFESSYDLGAVGSNPSCKIHPDGRSPHILP